MNMQVDIKKVFKFDRSINKLLVELEIFKNFLTLIDNNNLSEKDRMELVELARNLFKLKEEIKDKEAINKINEVFRLIANKIGKDETEEDRIWALRGDIGYLDYLEAKEKGKITVISSDEELERFFNEL